MGSAARAGLVRGSHLCPGSWVAEGRSPALDSQRSGVKERHKDGTGLKIVLRFLLFCCHILAAISLFSFSKVLYSWDVSDKGC